MAAIVKIQRAALAAGVVLALAVQLVAAVHLPGSHDETARTCGDVTFHFCSESIPSDTTPCALCRIGTGGLTLIQVEITRFVGDIETVTAAPESAPRAAAVSSACNPRAPPVLPA